MNPTHPNAERSHNDDDTVGRRFTLPDILEPGLDLVFVGINPSIYSAQLGHYFARPSNRFWTELSASGLVPVPLGPSDDRLLPKYGIGLTDVVKRPTRAASDVPQSEFVAEREALRAKLVAYAPRAVCFVGKQGYVAFSGNRSVEFGRQPDVIGAATVFVMPSTSGRANAYHRERRACLEAIKEFLGR